MGNVAHAEKGIKQLDVYLASPRNQMQASHLDGMPVLLSFAVYSPFIDGYQPSFKRIMIDSGAFSVFSSGKTVDLNEYADWSERWDGHVEAVAGLDDIAGNWRLSLKNYEKFPGGFPTFHETDPPELLDDLVVMAQERNQWLGLGLLPPREGKERWVRDTCSRIPDGIHVHGWAMRIYTQVRRIDSVDSTNWFRAPLDILKNLPWLTYAEALGLVIKRYERWERKIVDVESHPTLF